MLNPFPDLLAFWMLAPFILRMTVGALFILSGWQHLVRERREGIASQLRVAWGATGTYFIWYLGIIEIIVGALFIVGFLTQIAAVIAAIIALKLLAVRKRYPMVATGSPSHYLLVIAISAALLLTGAGALAIDLPL